MTIDEAPAPVVETPDTLENAIRYLALGDSYTIGEAVPEADRYPEQLAAALRRDNYPVEELTIVARTGWTTDDLYRGIQNADLPETPYDLVSLLIGVNNQYQGRSLENYQEEFESLLQRAILLSGNRADRVIVLSIPDYGPTPFISSTEQAERIAAEIDAFNAAAAEICRQYQVLFLDITPISRRAADDPALIAPDGLHPSGKMYGLWADLMLPEIKSILE